MRKTWETSEDIFKTGRKERREEKRGEDRKEILFSFGKYPPIIDSGLRFKKKKETMKKNISKWTVLLVRLKKKKLYPAFGL